MEKRCPRCGRVKPFAEFHNCRGKKWGKSSWCGTCVRWKNNVRNRATRVAVLNHYGGKCACCGETRLEFLALDHINGGGRQHRRTVKIRWWEWVRRQGFPKEFRVLCHNCNQSIGIYGYCPHTGHASIFEEALASYDPNAPNRSYKLTKEQVLEIRRKLADGTSQADITREYKISRAAACVIASRKRWANV